MLQMANLREELILGTCVAVCSGMLVLNNRSTSSDLPSLMECFRRDITGEQEHKRTILQFGILRTRSRQMGGRL